MASRLDKFWDITTKWWFWLLLPPVASGIATLDPIRFLGGFFYGYITLSGGLLYYPALVYGEQTVRDWAVSFQLLWFVWYVVYTSTAGWVIYQKIEKNRVLRWLILFGIFWVFISAVGSAAGWGF